MQCSRDCAIIWCRERQPRLPQFSTRHPKQSARVADTTLAQIFSPSRTSCRCACTRHGRLCRLQNQSAHRQSGTTHLPKHHLLSWIGGGEKDFFKNSTVFLRLQHGTVYCCNIHYKSTFFRIYTGCCYDSIKKC